MSSSSMSSQQDQEQEDQAKMTMEMLRKRKRMISNRESARRSRLRKQMQVDGLMTRANELRAHNSQMKANISATTMLCMDVEAENSILRAQLVELTNRLHALEEIIRFGVLGVGGFPAVDYSDHHHHHHQEMIGFEGWGFDDHDLGFIGYHELSSISMGFNQDVFLC